MTPIPTAIDRRSSAFQTNQAAMTDLVARLRAKNIWRAGNYCRATGLEA